MNSVCEQTESKRGTLFETLSQLPAEQRAVELDKACGTDAALRERLETLLAAHDRVGEFMTRPAARALPGSGRFHIPVAERLGDQIGHYKLLQQIGEGGCGVVYMAQQEQPVRRLVALKVIKLGMDTRQVVARFEAERQALALMDHPSIAKVLDGGATEAGRPFFVMELVRGIRITEYCDQNQLATKERLELFIQVCRAIQHAHQKGIIHRDIKPSNILVTIADGVPVPKVIDFGIAKATQGRLTDKTLVTAFDHFIGTPAYVSPEQAMMTNLDIDTRSDIYSLGVLLYELLTGKTPFDTQQLLKAGLDELRRTICEKQPARPSTRLDTMDKADLTTAARARHVEPGKLTSQLRGDLDWIAMKCLEKDRTRRYEAASGLAKDIERHLSHEPVTARPPNKLYEFQKSVRRHWVGFAATAAVLTVLAAGVVVSTLEALRARKAEQDEIRERQLAQTNEKKAQANERKAQTEATKSRQVAQFLEDMLKSVEPSVALGGDTTMLKGILDRTAERVGNELKTQPEVEAELCGIIGNTYNELGDYAEAVEMERSALKLRKALYGEVDPTVASTLCDLGVALDSLQTDDGWAEAESVLREAVEICRHLPGPPTARLERSLKLLAVVLGKRGKRTEAEVFFHDALSLQKKLSPNGNEETAWLLQDFGELLLREGRLAEAEAVNRQVLEMTQRLWAKESPEMASALAKLGLVLLSQGRLAEGRAIAA